MHAGQSGPVIERELRERPVFLVVLSPAALRSRWVEDETRWAYGLLRREPSRIILPMLAIDDVVSHAESKLEAIRVLEANGLVVRDVAVLVDREQGAATACRGGVYAARRGAARPLARDGRRRRRDVCAGDGVPARVRADGADATHPNPLVRNCRLGCVGANGR